jgi:predicted flap endonuclease-1-like 5' DNA nuclease
LSLVDATTAAAAAAVAVAKAAAAASVAATTRTPEPAKSKAEDTPPPKAKVPVDEKPPEKSETKPETKPADKPVETAKPVEKSVEKSAAPPPPAAKPQPARAPVEGGDDFQRIRAIDADIEQRLKAEGVDDFEHMAAWTAADVKRISQTLGIPGRIDREQWVEQAQILAKGGETYYSRNRLAAQKAATPVEKSAISETATKAVQAAVTSPPKDQPKSTPANEPSKESATSVPQIKPAAPASTPSQLSGVAAASHGRSVAEMASAAAAAIAAASASVTRGLKPIEPISPLSRVDPKISIPARLSDAIKEKGAALASAAPRTEVEPPRPMPASSQGPDDDLKRIRGIGVLIEKRLKAIGISRYDQIANWTSGDTDRVSQLLEFKGRIERESWVEQARILSSGGYTEFSRRVDRGEVDTSRET